MTREEEHKEFIDKIINEKSNFKIGINRELVDKELTKKYNDYLSSKEDYNNRRRTMLAKQRKELEIMALKVDAAIDISESFSNKLNIYLDDKYRYDESDSFYSMYRKYEFIVDIIFIRDDQAMKRTLVRKLKKNNSYLNKIRIGELERELKELDRRLTNIRKSRSGRGGDYITYIIKRNREVH